MATISTFKIPDGEVPDGVGSQGTHVQFIIPGTATTADNGDDISVLDLPPGAMFYPSSFSVSGTLGASCTAQLRIGTTAITAATTAGGASAVGPNGAYVATSTSELNLNILIGGADIAAAANFRIVGRIAYPHVRTLG